MAGQGGGRLCLWSVGDGHKWFGKNGAVDKRNGAQALEMFMGSWRADG